MILRLKISQKYSMLKKHLELLEIVLKIKFIKDNSKIKIEDFLKGKIKTLLVCRIEKIILNKRPNACKNYL